MRSSIMLFAAVLAVPTAMAAPPVAREQLNAVLWLQYAHEYRGNALQTYRSASQILVNARRSTDSASIEQSSGKDAYSTKPPAVVLDIDETVLDNTPYNALLVRDGKDYDSKLFAEWVVAKSADAIPGAIEFILAARALGFTVIFITNRECKKDGPYDTTGRSTDCPQRAATIDNLERLLGYRPTGEELMLRHEKCGRNDDDKKARRIEVAERYRIAILVGDDLRDFVRDTEFDPAVHDRFWGERWFVLGNPIYGSWERALGNPDAKYAKLKVWNRPAPASEAAGSVPSPLPSK